MILALATKTQMKYRVLYLINIYSCFFSFERDIFLNLFNFTIRKNLSKYHVGFFDLANVSVTKVSLVKEDEIKIKMGVYMLR